MAPPPSNSWSPRPQFAFCSLHIQNEEDPIDTDHIGSNKNSLLPPTAGSPVILKPLRPTQKIANTSFILPNAKTNSKLAGTSQAPQMCVSGAERLLLSSSSLHKALHKSCVLNTCFANPFPFKVTLGSCILSVFSFQTNGLPCGRGYYLESPFIRSSSKGVF